MRYVVDERSLWFAIAISLSLGLSASGCGAFGLRQDVESARSVWTVYPDGERAVAYAEALHDAFVRHAYAELAVEFTQRADEALAGLAIAENMGGTRLPNLLACRGLLLLDLGRHREGWAELQRSMAIAPTLVAAGGIVSVWGAIRRSDKVADACARTLPAMRATDRRFELLDLCVKNMHAVNEATALAWAPADAVVFYRDERRRREELAAAQEQQAIQAGWLAIEQAQQAAALANQQALDLTIQSAIAAGQQVTAPQ